MTKRLTVRPCDTHRGLRYMMCTEEGEILAGQSSVTIVQNVDGSGVVTVEFFVGDGYVTISDKLGYEDPPL